MNSPLNYLGGKSRLADRIVPMIPPHTCYVEPFCGAAWVFFRKPSSKTEVLNDRDGELIVFWRVIQNHLEEFLRFFKYAVVSRKLFELENRKDPETLTDIQRAVRYYYLQRLGFGGKTHKRTFGTGTDSSPRLNLTNMEEILLEVHWRLASVCIEHLEAVECITRYDRPHTFFYIDPPYWGTAGYVHPFNTADYVRLSDVLAGISGKFILSLNDVPEVRKVFKRFALQRISTTYTCANGRTKAAGRNQLRFELLIHNFSNHRIPMHQ